MTLFIVNEIEFDWDDILAASQVWGEWDEMLSQARRGVAAERRASLRGDGPSSGDVQAAATRFRYEHNLISGQDAQLWLERWGLTVEDWMGYFRRELLRRQWGDRLERMTEQEAVPDDELAKVMRAEVLCSGRFAMWARKLAGQAAVSAKAGAQLERQASTRGRIEHVEIAFQNEIVRATTPTRLQAIIADHRMDWMRFDCRYVWFPEERIAREAAHCVAADGLSLDDVAFDARSIVQHWDFYLDELETPVRPHFLAARAGDWLGPIQMMEGYPLFAIERKRPPTSEDPRIRERAEASIVKNLMEQEINHRIKWIVQL
jgi:hypothetical protein